MLVKLKDVVTFHRGLAYKKSDEVTKSSKIVLRANNIDLLTFKLNLDDLRYISESIDIPETKIVKKGSILICTASGSKSHLGKVALIKEDYGYAFGGFMGILLPKTEDIDMGYLFKVLTSSKFRSLIDSLTDGANINNLKFSLIEEFSFHLPPLEEQCRIVAKLDAAFAKIDQSIKLTENSLALSSALRSSLIEKYMSEESAEPIHLGDFCKFENGDRGKNYPSKSKQIASGIPFINAGNLSRSKIDFTGMAYISQATFDSLGGGKIRRNDILFCLRGSLGKFASVGDLTTGAIASSLVIIRPDTDRALTDYLLYYFEGEQCSRMIRKFENGAAQPNLSGGSLKKFEIILPDVKRQTRVVELLNMATDKIDTVTELRKKKLQSLHLLKHSMLSQAFSESAVK